MHEDSSRTGLAAVCARVGQPPLHGLSQRPDIGRPMVAGGPQHGARLAHPPQPSASQGQPASDRQADVESVRSPGGLQCCPDRVQRHAGKLAEMGAEPHDGREPLYPQGTEDVVTDGRPSGPVSTDNVLRLLDHQHYRCALTGRALTPETAAIDHMRPIRLGGTHTIENTQVLHKDVNRAKGSMTSEEFVGLCREVARWSETAEAREEMRP